ncbi:MAG: hypothetical protein Kow0029_19970 [Candidatus Rifleibacteriota bacterium]
MPTKISNRNIDANRKTPQTAKTPQSSSKTFTSKLKDARIDVLSNDLNELAKIVKQRGENFLKAPDEKLLQSYKEAIKQFLTKVSKEFYSLKEEFGAQKDGEQKVFQLVNSTDSEVESLTKETLTHDKAVNLLASLDDIRGLVLDIVG